LGLIRLVFWALMAALLVALWRSRKQREGSGHSGSGSPGGPRGEPRGGAAQDATPDARRTLVSCSACGLRLPRGDAIAHRGGWACCSGHVGRGQH
jgi:hypothetical protein